MLATADPSTAGEQADLRKAVLHHLTYSLATPPAEAEPRLLLQALELAVRDRLTERLLATEQRYRQAHAKRLYYLSMEFLIGRSLVNNLLNLGLYDQSRDALKALGFDLADVSEMEVDAALGNGGLGRLAACFLDSLATLDLPGFGYGINYEYGLFKQEIHQGRQIEKPDNWRSNGTPWLIERPQELIIVPMYGRIEHAKDPSGHYNPMWLDWRVVIGTPADMPIAGYGGKTVNYLRLFTARASREVDLSTFNEGDYLSAVQQKVMSETISKVLYPSEAVAVGRELRLVQEYFLVACAIRDIVRRFQAEEPKSFDRFAQKVAIQLNDTHPTLAIPELMRLLVDEQEMAWEKAWEITTATFGYTNHTLLPEALEKWPVDLLEKVLPRHLQIIYEINHRFLDQVKAKWPEDVGKLQRMSIVEEGGTRQARMANLAIIGSHAVNGVAAVHSELVKTDLVPDFAALWPEKFNNKTNGVTPRRWLLASNPGLAGLITEAIGPGWITDLDKLHALEPLADDATFRKRFRAAKRANKERLGAHLKASVGMALNLDGLLDVQVKRMHEYKRQLLNLLHVAYDYLTLVDDGKLEGPPRTYLIAGKAAPGYQAAKRIIQLIHEVGHAIAADKKAAGKIQLQFVPDYRVSLAEVIIPAAELSEQVSTAGTEASGTGNMKFAMNGALTIGTLDGANIEIREEVGPENIFIFGLTVPEVQQLKARGYRPWEYYERSPAVRRVMDGFRANRFCPKEPGKHAWVWDKLLADHEPYLHLADFDSYLQAHAAAGKLYQDVEAWTAMAIRNVARIGKFSSDRTIREYAQDIWGIKAVPG